jgi:hypothetical protein
LKAIYTSSVNYSKGRTHVITLGEKAFTLISNAPRNGVALNCSNLLPPTRMGKNPTKT